MELTPVLMLYFPLVYTRSSDNGIDYYNELMQKKFSDYHVLVVPTDKPDFDVKAVFVRYMPDRDWDIFKSDVLKKIQEAIDYAKK